MQTQFELGNYIHACTNETHSLTNLQDLIPTLANCVAYNKNILIMAAKVRIKSCRFAAWM